MNLIQKSIVDKYQKQIHNKQTSKIEHILHQIHKYAYGQVK